MTNRKLHAKWAGALACCIAMAVPVQAGAQTGASEAEEIRSLNIMLMVTSLRCRTTEFDFRDEYHRFNVAHKDSINGAGRQVRTQMQARYGARGSKRELDRVGVNIANSYGAGHPWADCAQLKAITGELSGHRDRVRLSAVARELLGPTPQQLAINSAP